MSSNAELLSQIGFDFIVKVVRIAVETVCYGIYILLISFSTIVLCRKGWKAKGVLYLLVVTLVMFAASTLFLAMDIADIVERLQILLVDNPDLGFEEKQQLVNAKVERLVWTGEMLFIFMLILGDSVVVWRTWAVYWDNRKLMILPILTWTGSVVAAFYELGCDVRTGWSLGNTNPSAGSVGSVSCARADTSGFSLSFATNIICTSLIALRTWQHRQSMIRFLGSVRRKTQAQKIMTLLVESGMIYLALYIFQAIPIYGGSFSSGSLIAVEAVNAIVQQAMGMYPTVIVVLVQMQKSLWDTPEVTLDMTEMHFASRPSTSKNTGTGTGTDKGTSQHTEQHTVFVYCTGEESSNMSVKHDAIELMARSTTRET